MTERDFKGVWIPKEVWLDKRLNMLEKGILAEIDSLDMADRGCFASNKHIAEFCGCSETKVSTAVSKLISLGYIYVQKFDGRQRELKSRLSNFERQTFKNEEAESHNLKDSNTNNKTSIKTDNKRFTPPTIEEVRAYCLERKNNVDAERIIDYYNANGWKVGRNPMKDWKAAVRTWERNDFSKSNSYNVGANGVKVLPENQRNHTLDGIL